MANHRRPHIRGWLRCPCGTRRMPPVLATSTARRFHLHTACVVLALCDMATLYLRNVPDDVIRRLQQLAERDGTSVSAVAVRELSDVSRRADNPALIGALPDWGVDARAIVEGVDQERANR